MAKVQANFTFSLLCSLFFAGALLSVNGLKHSMLEIPNDVKEELAETDLSASMTDQDETWHPNIRLTSYTAADGSVKQSFVDKRSGASPFPSLIQLQNARSSSKSLDLKSFYEQYSAPEEDSLDAFQDLGCSCKFVKATLQDSLSQDFNDVAYTQMPSLDSGSTPFSMIQKTQGEASAALNTNSLSAASMPSSGISPMSAASSTYGYAANNNNNNAMNNGNQVAQDFKEFEQFLQMKGAQGQGQNRGLEAQAFGSMYGNGYNPNNGFLQQAPPSLNNNAMLAQAPPSQQGFQNNNYYNAQPQPAAMNQGYDSLNEKLKMMAYSQ